MKLEIVDHKDFIQCWRCERYLTEKEFHGEQCNKCQAELDSIWK